MGLPSWHWPQVPAPWMVVKCVQGVAVGAPVHWCIGALVRWCIGALVREMLDYMVRAGGTRLPLLIEKMSQQSLYIVYYIPYIIPLYIAVPGSRWLRRCNNKAEVQQIRELGSVSRYTWQLWSLGLDALFLIGLIAWQLETSKKEERYAMIPTCTYLVPLFLGHSRFTSNVTMPWQYSSAPT